MSSKTIEPQWGQVTCLSSPVAGNGLFEIAFFEVDASLKWMPQQSKLKSGLTLHKRENPTVRAYTTKWLVQLMSGTNQPKVYST